MFLQPIQNKHTNKQVLCANRGEIAVRVFRAAAELGILSVAGYSIHDRNMPHRYKADESYQLNDVPGRPVACYLDVEGLVELAKKHGVDAIHPGYGFLSERADFAQRCEEEGITFVGPSANVLASLGDKTTARRIAKECNVATVPGTDEPLSSADEAKDFCKTYGLPVIMKAAMGGGGRGMRVVRSMDEVEETFVRCASEAEAAFGDGRIFIEKFVEDPRHIEVQILADGYGNVVHLFERDCSVQRRHQKVVEMAPAHELDDKVRQAIFDDAITLAKHVNYKNAGTVEFLVGADGSHYFIEINPRIQVEHTVTEEVTGIDLVQSQIKIAGGASLADLGIHSQDDVSCSGFAMQCRVTAEDPVEGFRPDSGKLDVYRTPGGYGVRLDGGLDVGSEITPYYDSLLVKLTVRGSDFEQACVKMRRSLAEFRIRGVKTNLPFLQNVLDHPIFLSGDAKTTFIDNNGSVLFDLPYRADRNTKVMNMLAEFIVNGPNHKGWSGGPPPRIEGGENGMPAPPNVPGLDKPPPDGWRKVLLEKGPAGFAAAVREEGRNGRTLLTDTTMRDAHQSLLATRMRTSDMMAAAPATARNMSQLLSLECWGGATFDVAYRFLHECPWRRLERLRAEIPNIPFQMLLRGANGVGYSAYPDNVVKGFVKEAVAAGVDIFRVFDSLNYEENLVFGVQAVVEAGGVAEGTICYTGDVVRDTKNGGKFTLDYYMKLGHVLVDSGAHMLAVKDMAGLLTPESSKMLIGALRAEFPDVPIHVHTHDTTGLGVASMLACADAGADVVDGGVDSMSGMTSQPSLGALIAGLGPERCGMNLEDVWPLSLYWEQVRRVYSGFECNLRAGSSDVYLHEMPGGQYTNLKFQATSLGLAEAWDDVKVAYATANRLLGNIPKVTPSSKVVGDLAQFIVSSGLTEEEVVDQAEQLSFPSSVVDYMQGYLGQPPGGFPEPLRSRVLGKDKETVSGRPGASMAPMDLDALRIKLTDKWGRLADPTGISIRERDVLSAAMYPDVFEEYCRWRDRYGDCSRIPTRAFVTPMEQDEEISVVMNKGRIAYIKFKALGELLPGNEREVFFELNGLPRVVRIVDKTVDKNESESGASATREKADPNEIGEVGAPLSGDVIKVSVKAGQMVKAGEELVVCSAMKMETSVRASCDGKVKHVGVVAGDSVKTGDLLISIDDSASAESETPEPTAEVATA